MPARLVTVTGLVAVLVCAVVAGCSSATTGSPVAGRSPSTPPSSPPATAAPSSSATPSSQVAATGKSCDYQADPSGPPPGKEVGMPEQATDSTAESVTLKTSAGDIPIDLTADTTQCTVRSIVHLAGSRFYDNTICHRLTTSIGLRVLQCGDPTGTGTGGPGYTIPDENPTGLPDAPGASGDVVVYPRGTVAMANTGQPNSGGSQFFLVYDDSTLPPTYAVFGTVTGAGLTVLDKIARGGLASSAQHPEDGPPATPVRITQAVVAG